MAKDEVKKSPATGKKKIDWAAMGYEEDSEEYASADSIKVNTGPTKFKVQAKKKYRIGFPFVAPSKKGDGFDVRLKPVEHLKYFEEDEGRGAKFVMPKDPKLRKEVIEVFGNKAVSTHYLTPIVVYDTNDEGKLLSRDSISYSIKILAVTPGRYAKLQEAASKFSLADYDFLVTLEGDEKTEHYQKMNFDAVTIKKDLMAKTAAWQKGLVRLPDDEDEDPIPVSMEEIIAECYEIAAEMIKVLGTNELKDSKIKEIIAEWSDVEEEEEDEEYYDEDEEESDEMEDEDESDGEDDTEEDDVEDEEDEPAPVKKKPSRKFTEEDDEE